MAAVVVMAFFAAFLAVTMATTTSARAEEKTCNYADFEDTTGYLVCLGLVQGSGSAVGSAVVPAGEDLPVTGSDPTRIVVIGSACIVVGAAAVIGSLQARKRSRTSA
jgi:hypothetical protein